MTNKILIILILILALILRTVDINTFSPGVYLDEASMAYDAYSLGMRGVDQYGKSWPIYLRSFAMYQAPLYTYLSILPIQWLDVTPIGIRIVSVVSGVVTIFLIYLLMSLVFPVYGKKLGLFSAFVLAISPWHILFSRNALESNLGLFIFVLSIYLLLLGLYKKSKVAIFLGLVALAITNYAYHSYRFTSIITAVFFLMFFWQQLTSALKKTYLIGMIFFCLILIPQLTILNTTGSLRRLELLDYTSEKYFQQNGGDFREFPLGRYMFITRALSQKAFDYLSPRSIFFDSDPAVTKSIPELSSFYSWMIIFYIWGIVAIIRNHHSRILLFFIFIGLISIVPAAITTDNLYLLRTLNYLLVVAIIIALGLMEAINLIKYKAFKVLLLVILLVVSLTNFNINYLHISQHESKGYYSGLFNEAFEYTKLHKDDNFIVDFRLPHTYGVALYVYKYDPYKWQESVNLDLVNYYGDIPEPKSFVIDNLNIREIEWSNDVYKEQYLVGDEESLPEGKAAENELSFINRFTADLDFRQVVIYKTNPKQLCLRMLGRYKTLDNLNSVCTQYLDKR